MFYSKTEIVSIEKVSEKYNISLDLLYDRKRKLNKLNK